MRSPTPPRRHTRSQHTSDGSWLLFRAALGSLWSCFCRSRQDLPKASCRAPSPCGVDSRRAAAHLGGRSSLTTSHGALCEPCCHGASRMAVSASRRRAPQHPTIVAVPDAAAAPCPHPDRPCGSCASCLPSTPAGTSDGRSTKGVLRRVVSGPAPDAGRVQGRSGL